MNHETRYVFIKNPQKWINTRFFLHVCIPIFKKVFILATLRLRWRQSRDGFKVHCGTALGDEFSTWWQIRPLKQSHNAL